jgi:hypothetical protein
VISEERLAIIKNRLANGQPIDPRDIGWLIDELDHAHATLEEVTQIVVQFSTGEECPGCPDCMPIASDLP